MPLALECQDGRGIAVDTRARDCARALCRGGGARVRSCPVRAGAVSPTGRRSCLPWTGGRSRCPPRTEPAAARAAARHCANGVVAVIDRSPYRPTGFEELLTSAEVAVMSRVNLTTVIRWVRAEKLLSLRMLGGRHRDRQAEIDALLRGETP